MHSVELIRCSRAYGIDIRLREMEEQLEIHRVTRRSEGMVIGLSRLPQGTRIHLELAALVFRIPVGRPRLLSVSWSSACNIQVDVQS